MTNTYKPTAKIAANAVRGLKLREQFDRGGTNVGVNRGKQLAERRDLSKTDVKAMHSYFARHEVDKQAKGQGWGSKTDPSAGYIAWLLWGGDDGKKWADAHAKQLQGRLSDFFVRAISSNLALGLLEHPAAPGFQADSSNSSVCR